MVLHIVRTVRITSAELQLMAVQYRCHVIQTEITCPPTFISVYALGIVQRLRFSGFILYPLSYFFYSPFKLVRLNQVRRLDGMAHSTWSKK